MRNIFDNNFKEVKKNLNSAYRALREPRARLHLCACLQKYVKRNQVILSNEQFECVLKLLNEALLNDTRLDEHGLAYSVLPLTSAFYRKLNNGTVDQCVYTRLQQHEVWSNMQFWEMSFYSDVQRSIRAVYLSNEEFAAEQDKENNLLSNHSDNCSMSSTASTGNLEGMTDALIEAGNLVDEVQGKESVVDCDEVACKSGGIKRQRPDKLNLFAACEKKEARTSSGFGDSKTSLLPKLSLNLYSRPTEKTALEICGEQMERVACLTAEQRENFIRNEQGI